MEVAIHVNYIVKLDREDAKGIDAGEMNAEDIDWSYYIEGASEIDLECIEFI